MADATEPLLIARAARRPRPRRRAGSGLRGDGGGRPGQRSRVRLRAPGRGHDHLAVRPRFHPILQVWKLHTGIDIGAACGTPVKAVKDGKVSFVGIAGGYGNRVVVDHGNGLATTYNHFSAYAATAGLQVRQGQIIGYVGTTGLSTGCHLHFEVVVNGSIVDAGPYLDLAPAPKVVIPPAVTATTPPPPAPPPPATPRAATPALHRRLHRLRRRPRRPTDPSADHDHPAADLEHHGASDHDDSTPHDDDGERLDDDSDHNPTTTTKTTQPPVSKPPTPSPTAVEEPSTPSTSSTTTAP